jgi:glutathione peroxidase-family protein
MSDCAKGKRILHEFTDKLLLGEENISFSQNKDQIVIVTNVASFWGITVEQYQQLNALVKEFNTTRCPLKVFGVPCNQFGLQEPGQGIEIVKSLQYVRPGNGFKPNFDLLVKRDVNGEKEDALFTWLKVCCLSSRYQDVFALLVPGCCDKSGTSCYHLVTRLMTVTDLLQVVPTRLIHAVRNKLLRIACCHQLVNNLLRADDGRLVGTTCCEFLTCQQLGTSSANTS